MLYQVQDWDDAYANGTHIPQGDSFVPAWQDQSAAFRAAARHQPLGSGDDLAKGDLFLPDTAPKGLCIIIHGGYWMKFGPSLFSHLAAGPLARGHAVAMPAYTLAPDARIGQMTRQIAAAIIHAASQIAGPITITGHSAGGHLAARMVCNDATLPAGVLTRIRNCVPVSALTDLRPLMRTAMNPVLQIDRQEALTESPALLEPVADIPVVTWVGGAERPEFIRQSQLLANIWAGLGAATECVIDPGRHHFDVIDALTRPDSPLTDRLLA